MLSYKWSCHEWDIGGSSRTKRLEGTIEVAVGAKLDLYGFKNLTITSISHQAIFLSDGTVVMKGQSTTIKKEIDGHEDHDGVLWNGEELSLTLTYK